MSSGKRFEHAEALENGGNQSIYLPNISIANRYLIMTNAHTHKLRPAMLCMLMSGASPPALYGEFGVLTFDIQVDGGTAPPGVFKLSTTVGPCVFEGRVSGGQDASWRFRVQSPVGRDGAIPFHTAIAHTSQGHRCTRLYNQLWTTRLDDRGPLTCRDK